jgi:hypothetical protein
MATQDTQDWLGAYLELAELIKTKIPEIQHVDLWYNQLSYETEEYLYPEKSLFIDFRANSIDTIGNNVQEMNFTIGFIFAFDTLSDSFDDSPNQAVALEFGATLRKIHTLLQARSGANFSSLNRIGMDKENAPAACIAYRQTYSAIIMDYGATPVVEEVDLSTLNIAVEVIKNTDPGPVDDINLYQIPI